MKHSIKNIDNVLTKLIDELERHGLKLHHESTDGRLNSIKDEKLLLDLILKTYQEIAIFKENDLVIVMQPQERYWYDMLIKNEDLSFYVPINIKVTMFSKNASDNLNSKEGLYFSLTGEIEQKVPNGWNQFFATLSQNIKEHQSDYYFLVLNKDDNKFYFNSLRRLKTLTPNGNNLPFQSKWKENVEIVDRSFLEAKNFILNTLYLSVKKRAQILNDYEEHFKDFLTSKSKEVS